MEKWWQERVLGFGFKLLGTAILVIGVGVAINNSFEGLRFSAENWLMPLAIGILGTTMYGAGYAIEAAINSRKKS